MLSIAKVRPGGERYYFSTVEGVTDLPAGLVEPDPYWLGDGARALGLAGRVTPEVVRSLLSGKEPASGEPLATRAGRRAEIGAYDVTLSTPKSVSIVHALCDPAAAKGIEAAHHEAVAACVGFIEHEVLSVRRSAKGSRWEVGLDGAVAAAFVHRTTRANDPHLHTHVLVMNVAEGKDGSFSALHSRPLYRSQREVRALYEAHLRAGLTELGIELGPIRRDYAEIASIPPEAVVEFSRQSRAIAAAMGEEGLVGPSAAAVVAGAIRPAKDRTRPYEALQAEWRERGYEVGLSAGRIREAAGAPGRSGRSQGLRHCPEDLSWVLSAVPGDARDGTFSRSDLVIARCSAAREGARVDEVASDVSSAIEGGSLINLGGRFTTSAHMARLTEASGRLGERARSSGALLVAYREDGRTEALDRLGQLGSDVLAVAPGKRAARRFEGATGIETYPLREMKALSARLGSRTKLVAAECGIFTEKELAACMTACERAEAPLVLFGSEASIGRSRLLDSVVSQVPRLELEGQLAGGVLERKDLEPGVTAHVVADLSSAREEVAAVASSQAAAGRIPLIAVPDASLAAEMRAVTSVPVVESSRLASVLEKGSRSLEGGHDRVVVVLGCAAALEAAPGELARLERVHVLVSPGGAGLSPARVAEATEPASVTSELGPLPASPAGREAWRAGADLMESFRLRRAGSRELETTPAAEAIGLVPERPVLQRLRAQERGGLSR